MTEKEREGQKVVVMNQEEAEDILDIYSDMLEEPQDWTKSVPM